MLHQDLFSSVDILYPNPWLVVYLWSLLMWGPCILILPYGCAYSAVVFSALLHVSESHISDECWNVDRAGTIQVVSIKLHFWAVLLQSGAGGLWFGWVPQRPDTVWHDSLLHHVRWQRNWKRPASHCWCLLTVIYGNSQHECIMGTMQKVNLMPDILH